MSEDKKDIEKSLFELFLSGDMEITKGKTETYNLTEQGRERARQMIRDKPEALAMFYAMLYNSWVKEYHKAITSHEKNPIDLAIRLLSLEEECMKIGIPLLDYLKKLKEGF
jgi:hypothetical protein